MVRLIRENKEKKYKCNKSLNEYGSIRKITAQ